MVLQCILPRQLQVGSRHSLDFTTPDQVGNICSAKDGPTDNSNCSRSLDTRKAEPGISNSEITLLSWNTWRGLNCLSRCGACSVPFSTAEQWSLSLLAKRYIYIKKKNPTQQTNPKAFTTKTRSKQMQKGMGDFASGLSYHNPYAPFVCSLSNYPQPSTIQVSPQEAGIN